MKTTFGETKIRRIDLTPEMSRTQILCFENNLKSRLCLKYFVHLAAPGTGRGVSYIISSGGSLVASQLRTCDMDPVLPIG